MVDSIIHSLQQPWVTNAVALAGLALGLINFAWSWKNSRDTNKVQRQAAKAQGDAANALRKISEIEYRRHAEQMLRKSQADLRAKLERRERCERIVIQNCGDAEARNIRLFLDGKPFEEHCSAPANAEPPAQIGPGGDGSVLVAVRSGCVPPWELELRWDDDSGPDRVYRTTLTL